MSYTKKHYICMNNFLNYRNLTIFNKAKRFLTIHDKHNCQIQHSYLLFVDHLLIYIFYSHRCLLKMRHMLVHERKEVELNLIKSNHILDLGIYLLKCNMLSITEIVYVEVETIDQKAT